MRGVSRYTCRSRFPQNPGFFRCSSNIALHPPPLKGPVAPVALELPGVSHVKLPLKWCRATWGCSSYTCGCRATLVRGLLGTGPPAPPSNPPRPPLLKGRFGIDSTSNRHRNRVKSGNRCRIDVKSMLKRCEIDPRGGEGEADSRVGSGGPLCLISPSPHFVLKGKWPIFKRKIL